MTDNTQELNEIIREMRYRVLEDNGLTVNGLTTIEQETKQAILDWHNKQVEEVLDRLEAATPDYSEMDSYNRSFLKAMYENTISKAIEAERNKLKERRNDQSS